MSESDPILELEALLDPARLAAAWQIARQRPPAADVADTEPATDDTAPDADADAEATEVEEGEPARTAPLPVALAHRQLLDEIERIWAASPGIAAKARRVLAAPLAQLAHIRGLCPRIPPGLGSHLDAQAMDPADLAAAEATLDQLEDLLQALLSEAGWPESPGSEE